jgi:hypothetical protein
MACAPFGWLSWLASYLSVQRDARLRKAQFNRVWRP